MITIEDIDKIERNVAIGGDMFPKIIAAARRGVEAEQSTIYDRYITQKTYADQERTRAERAEAELAVMTKDRDLHHNRVASILFSGALDNMVAADLGVMVSEYLDAKAALAAAVAKEREACLDIVDSCEVPFGNSAAGELAAEWTMDCLVSVANEIRARADQPEYPSSADDEATRWRHGEKI
jgi:hypothetical protein